ncbi:hypothetical protein L1281_001256 [Neisseria sp. HSC-16F19]|nr:DUF4850 domain-containing protein [Neisseria sp. HSC-16F19]MCP2040667.1 hypothetical protein [Neisseria sp. HSC-16F19]
MKSTKFTLILSLGLACALPAVLHAQTAKPPFVIGETVQADTGAERATAVAKGSVRVNGVAVPAYGIRTLSPTTDEWLNLDIKAGEPLHSSATPAQLRQLAVYPLGTHWLLVPRGWQLKSGGVGANGSEAWTFAAADGSGWLHYRHSGACVGCAQSAAAPFFPEARRDAQDNDFDFYGQTDVPIKSVRLRPHLTAYQAEKNQGRIDGLVYYKADDDLPHWHLEVSLPAAQQDLAQPILNRLVPKR